jgi:predicted DNA-binding transcriptional regulator YafY
MTHFERILTVYSLLKQSPHGVEQIASHFSKEAPMSRFQVIRDLKEVRQLAATQQEKLIDISTGRNGRKLWKIVPIETASSLNNYDLTTYFISRAVLPGVFADNRKQSLDALQKTLEAKAISSTAVKYKSGVSKKTFINSNFYENKVTDVLDRKLNDILELIDQDQTILINRLAGDSTSVSDVFSVNDCVWPVKILFHRGCFYIATVRTADLRVLVFQIDHIDWSTDEIRKAPRDIQKLVDDNLRNSFGITQNYDERTYDIELLFSETTGKFVSEQRWHHSQKIEKKATSTGEVNYIVKLKCGINRELVGWLFQWMSNVKVLGPPELITLYNEQLDQMIAIRSSPDDAPLEYTNRFAQRP